jgi:hypothetical protein
MLGLEAAREAYSEAMDALRCDNADHAAAVTHAVLALIVAEREDEARRHPTTEGTGQ